MAASHINPAGGLTILAIEEWLALETGTADFSTRLCFPLNNEWRVLRYPAGPLHASSSS
jgi:hypothetical protein